MEKYMQITSALLTQKKHEMQQFFFFWKLDARRTRIEIANFE